MVQSQAQLIYLGYRQSAFTEETGVRVSDADSDGVVTRLGARLYRQPGESVVQPFAAFNWWRSSNDPSIHLDGTRIDNMYPKSRYELKAGLAAGLGKGWKGWASVAGNWGQQNFRAYAVEAGMRYQF